MADKSREDRITDTLESVEDSLYLRTSGCSCGEYLLRSEIEEDLKPVKNLLNEFVGDIEKQEEAKPKAPASLDTFMAMVMEEARRKSLMELLEYWELTEEDYVEVTAYFKELGIKL
ncbi:hypothetical protein [Bacillus thuringiensis]|uniref:hypothetical protein n=1 Tax=Bacillus thuringiensis TaxID=1428 RepID=UPI000BFCC201|nr:hypothetical protein [Bacillus thuringiensis]PGT90140.1 hypothetical protein COD17_10355 [Bacillus thuringiensis]